MVDISRSCRGPCLGPGRLVVPPSQGVPISPIRTSSSLGSSSAICGRRMKVGTPANRGRSSPETGWKNGSVIQSLWLLVRLCEMRRTWADKLQSNQGHLSTHPTLVFSGKGMQHQLRLEARHHTKKEFFKKIPFKVLSYQYDVSFHALPNWRLSWKGLSVSCSVCF